MSKFTIFIYSIKFVTRHESTLFTFGSSYVKWQLSGRGALAETFQFDLHFRSKISANLIAKWKTHGQTKPDNKMINHHSNWIIIVATFNGNPSIMIISCYSPTNASAETDLITFSDELSFLVCIILKHNILIIGGDMDAQIGKNNDNKFSLHNASNRNGAYLTDFSFENGLACLNTKFQKRKGKLWTYTYTNNAKYK